MLRILKNTITVYARSALLLPSTMILYLYSIHFAVQYHGYPLEGSVLTAQLRQVLQLSLYLFVAVVFLSYEFSMKFRHNGMDEVAAGTGLGKKGIPLACVFLTMTLWSLVFTVTLAICAVSGYLHYGIRDPGREYIIHILQNAAVNVFLVMELGILAGLLFSKIRNRIPAYAGMMLIAYLVSPYPERIADAQCMAGNLEHNIFPLVELFGILPSVRTGFDANPAFGESLSPARISLIFFWSAAILFLLCLPVRQRAGRLWAGVCVVAAAMCFGSYAAPVSDVKKESKPGRTMAHDQYYYEFPGTARTKKAAGGYEITAYDMDLEIRRVLEADIMMDVDRSMEEYKMTLYHGYRVEGAWDQDGREMDVTQDGDYLSIKAGGGDVSRIRLSYSGYSAAYYSNSQGIYLPGDFAWYPRAGYIPLHDDEKMAMRSCFVDADTGFRMDISYGGEIHTNLEEGEDGSYAGTCDGPTILAGFYKEKEFGDGNRLVYCYLNAECYAEGGLDEICREDEKALEEMGKEGVTIFMVPNVNQMRNRDVGERQILVRNSPWI